MKKFITLLLILGMYGAQAQTAPTGGKKVLPVLNKYENEYNLDVWNAFLEAPYNYHMKKLPKKLQKYGFTNVEITALGMVTTGPAKKRDVAVAIAYAQQGASVGTILNMLEDIKQEEFQVNFTSDQGTFKVRLSATATGIKYIIAE